MKPNFMDGAAKIIADIRTSTNTCIDDVDAEVIEEILNAALKEYCSMPDGYYYDGYYDAGYYDGYRDGKSSLEGDVDNAYDEGYALGYSEGYSDGHSAV